MPQAGKVVAFLRSLPGQSVYWLPGQFMASNKMYRPEDPLHKKFEFFFRRKAIWEMAALSATICGIEFCYAAETAFVSPLLRLLGTPTYFTSMVWGCSPILGVFVTPIFGSLSDACNSRFGRRRPFIAALSLIVLCGLALIASAVTVAQQTEASFMAEYTANQSRSEFLSPSSALPFFPALTLTPKATTRQITIPFVSVANSNNLTQAFTTTTTPITRLQPLEKGPATLPGVVLNLEEAMLGSELWTTETPPTSAAVHQLPIGMAILGVILMDFGCDASQSPCRTYLLDVCLPEDHRLGLRTFTVSAGLGGSIGYLMGGIDTSSTNDSAAVFFQHLKVVYTVIGFLFIIFVCSTIFVFQEPTLEEWRDLQAIATATQEAAKQEVEKLRAKGSKASYRKLNRQMSRKLQTGMAVKQQPTQTERLPLMATRSCSDAMKQFQIQREAQELHQEDSWDNSGYNYNNRDYNTNQFDYDDPNNVSRTKSADPNELQQMPTKQVKANESKDPTFLMYLRSIRHMPRSVGMVCLANYFSWMSLVCYSLYFTDFVGTVIFEGDATAAYGTPRRLVYEEGVRYGACGMSLYSFTCCIYSLFAEKIYKKIGLKYAYALGPTCYSAGLLLVVIAPTKMAAVLLSITAGLMYSTLFTMPYILIGKYHSHNMFDNFADEQQQQQQQHQGNNGFNNELPQPPPLGEVRGLGTDIALVSSMVFLAQFSVALLAGPLSHATDSPIVVIGMGSVAAAITAGISLKLYYPSKS